MANKALIAAHLRLLNENWKRYDDIENGLILFETPLQEGMAKSRANESYLYAELWLAEHGYRWQNLIYNRATKTYSLPEQGEADDEC